MLPRIDPLLVQPKVGSSSTVRRGDESHMIGTDRESDEA